MKHKYQAYAAATQTVAKTKQIVMLYDGAIRLVQQAKEAIRENRIEDRYHLLHRASEVLLGLQGCLDFEKGGDIAKILYQFYSSLDTRLFNAQLGNSADICNEVIEELKKMRDVWHDIDQGTTGASTASIPAAPAEASASENVTPPSQTASPTDPITLSA